MTKRLSLAVAVLSVAPNLFAVEVEGPSPSQAPTAPSAPLVQAPAIPSFPTISVPIDLDPASLPKKGAAPSPSAQAAANAPTASAAPVPALSAHAIPNSAQDRSLPLAAARPAKAESARAKTGASVAQISAQVAKAGEEASKATSGAETQSGSGREIERALTGEKEAPSDYVSVYLQGVKDGTIPSGPRLERTGKNEYRVRTPYSELYGVREQFVNPGDVYAEAYYAASFAAQKAGLSGRVLFGEVTGSLPLRDGDHAHFVFYPSGPAARRSAVYVDFKRGLTTLHGAFDVRTRVFVDVPAPEQALFPELDDAAGYGYVAKGFQLAPQQALDAARRAAPSFGRTGASFSARIEKDAETGDVDVWYRLYDDAGAQLAVNARTGRTRTVVEPAAPDRKLGKFKPGSKVGYVALLGAAGVAMWFMIAYVISRDAAFALRTVAPIAALSAVLVIGDMISNWRR